jgi:hypothetical protein
VPPVQIVDEPESVEQEGIRVHRSKHGQLVSPETQPPPARRRTLRGTAPSMGREKDDGGARAMTSLWAEEWCRLDDAPGLRSLLSQHRLGSCRWSSHHLLQDVLEKPDRSGHRTDRAEGSPGPRPGGTWPEPAARTDGKSLVLSFDGGPSSPRPSCSRSRAGRPSLRLQPLFIHSRTWAPQAETK